MEPKIKEGNLIELAKAGEFDLIIQGCNCYCTMGKGIALEIKETWPEAYEADLLTTRKDKSKLGTCSYAQIGSLTIANAYTQYKYYNKGKALAEYWAIESCMKEIKTKYGNKGLKIAYPLIGAGLAKGDWGIIYPLITNALAGEDQTLILYKD